jgi:hypothetical protein
VIPQEGDEFQSVLPAELYVQHDQRWEVPRFLDVAAGFGKGAGLREYGEASGFPQAVGDSLAGQRVIVDKQGIRIWRRWLERGLEWDAEPDLRPFPPLVFADGKIAAQQRGPFPHAADA